MHQHRCACGSVLSCAANLDQCAVIEPWDCPACLQRQRDEYFQQFAELRERRAALREVEDQDHAHHR